MKKIFWFVQQAQALGGTEMVTSSIISFLSSDYDITMVLTAKKPQKMVYALPENVKVKSLDFPIETVQMDKYMGELKKDHHYFKMFSLGLKGIWNTFIKRFYVRHKIKKMTTKEDILIASSFDNYILMPRGRLVYFHYHFNAKTFFSFGDFWMRRLMRKPNYYIFLTEETMQAFLKKRPRWKDRVYYIYNPSRFDRELHEDVHKPIRFIFVGRLAKQKNPMLMLESLDIVKKKKIPFELQIFGEGVLKDKMEQYVHEKGLDDCISFCGTSSHVEEYLKNADLLLVTSFYEGFPLNIIEASSLSCYTLSTNWGDAVKEVIEEGKNGSIIDSFQTEKYAEALIHFITSETLSEKKRKCYESAKRFEKDTIKEKWMNLLENSSF